MASSSFPLHTQHPPGLGITTLLLFAGELSEEAGEVWRGQPFAESEGLAPVRRGRVLLAEDDPLVASLVERLLDEAGYEVVAARHGVEALRLALQGGPDLLVTDVRMPVMDGWELSRQLHERWPDLPVIFISGYDIELAHGTSRPGRGAFLRKPFEPEELLRQVTRLLRR